MDTSEAYIKMRQKALPDLGMGKPPNLPLDSDVAWVDVTVFVDRLGFFYYSSVNTKPLGDEIECFQLERQDQLQEMVAGDMVAIHLEDAFHEYLQSYYSLPVTELDKFVDPTMEQLWLAFVMKEKYDKVWDGDNWV